MGSFNAMKETGGASHKIQACWDSERGCPQERIRGPFSAAASPAQSYQDVSIIDRHNQVHLASELNIKLRCAQKPVSFLLAGS